MNSSKQILKQMMPIVLAPLLTIVVWLWVKTLRIEVENREALFDEQGKLRDVLLAAWHNRLLVLTGAFSYSGVCALISQSRDGELVARVARYLGYQVIRGSSSRGALPALNRLKDAPGQAYFITVDGPRGPRYEVKPGIVYLAYKRKVPIVPLSYRYERAWHLRSWDGFVLPKPFSSVKICFGEKIWVKSQINKNNIEQILYKIKKNIDDISLHFSGID